MDDHDKVMRIVKTIVTSDVQDKEKHFSEIYKGFKKKMPHLFALACKQHSCDAQNDDMKMLNYMLDMMEKIKRKETTQNEASAVVGQHLFSQFVDVSKLKPAEDGKGGIQINTSRDHI